MQNRCTGRSTPTIWPAPNSLAVQIAMPAVWWSSPDPRPATPTSSVATRGREHVRHLVRIARELTECSGEPPRLYVVTRNAQTVLPDDRANLDQAGLRGLMRVIAR